MQHEREWVRLGALARLEQIEQERRAILARFPDLLKSKPTRHGPGGSRPGRKLSAAAKRRMSAGMRKWWAKKKATKATA